MWFMCVYARKNHETMVDPMKELEDYIYRV